MSEDEAIVMLIGAIASLALWGSWFHQHAVVAPAFSGASEPPAGGRPPRARRTLAFVIPLACAAILFVVLRSAASFDVRVSPLYIAFYMVMGAAWVGLAVRFTPVAGISARDDVIERRNGAAGIAITGAMLGLTFAFAGGNVGDGPGWWVVLFSALLATATLFGLWLALEAASDISDAITIDRDDASGMRLAGFLVAEGIILGRSVAGDWLSAADTVRDMALAAWPGLVLLGFAILVERSFRPTPRRPRPGIAAYGFFPAIAYVIAAVAVVLRLEVTR